MPHVSVYRTQLVVMDACHEAELLKVVRSKASSSHCSFVTSYFDLQSEKESVKFLQLLDKVYAGHFAVVFVLLPANP